MTVYFYNMLPLLLGQIDLVALAIKDSPALLSIVALVAFFMQFIFAVVILPSAAYQRTTHTAVFRFNP